MLVKGATGSPRRKHGLTLFGHVQQMVIYGDPVPMNTFAMEELLYAYICPDPRVKTLFFLFFILNHPRVDMDLFNFNQNYQTTGSLS